MHGRYPRSIIVTLCIILAVAAAATLGAGLRDGAGEDRDYRAKVHGAPVSVQPLRSGMQL